MDFQCEFDPISLTNERDLSKVVSSMYGELIIPILVWKDHELLKAVRVKYPDNEPTFMFVTISYKKPYES